MKNSLAIVLVLCMFMSLCAVAEESSFTLRNGYRWDMTIAEIEQLAKDEGLIPEYVSEGTYQVFENVPVAGYIACMHTMFPESIGDDLLPAIGYLFEPVDPIRDSNANKQMYNDLLAALIKLYGNPDDDGSGNDKGTIVWILQPDTKISLIIMPGPEPMYYCKVSYLYEPQPTETPTPTPEPTPEQTLVPVPNDGL